MLSVDESVFQSEKMVVVVFVELRIELFISSQRKLTIIEWRGKVIPSRAQTLPSYSG